LKVWIVSRLNAFGLTFLAGLFVGFALGTHAVKADIGPWIFGAIAIVALAGSLRDGMRRGAKAEPPTRQAAPLTSGPNTKALEDARDALIALGLSVRDARAAMARAVSQVGVDASVSDIVREALKKG
jgi:hypothetical protein